MKAEIRQLKFLLPVLGAFLLTAGARAADVQMTVEPQLISLLDRAVLKITFTDCKGDAADIPEIDGLSIQYRGPQSSYNFINGRSSSSITHTYIITPSRVGDYTIGPITVKYKGGEKVLSAKLRVIKKADDKEAQQLSELMFSRITSTRHNPYVHEPFDLSVKVYIRDGIQISGNFGLEGGMPEQGLDGELQWDVRRGPREEVNGAIFNTYELKTTAKALTAGTFSFQPQVQVQVVVPRQNRRPWGFDDPFFGDMFGRQETRPFTLDCNRLDIEVQPVPMAGRPASYTGGVGLFDFQASVGPTKVKAGEPITVKMSISGRGNLSKITPPTIEAGPDFKVYDVRSVPSNNPNEVRFEQVLIPTTDAVTNIPAIAFSYFNSRTSDFRTITRGPFPIEVEAVPQQAAQVIAAVPTAVQPETKVLGRDIVYLKPLPEKWRTAAGMKWYRRPFFQVLLALPLLLFLLTAAVTARRNRLAGNVALARRRKAPKAARAHVQRAEQALRKKDAAAFYEACWNALADYFGHRLNLAPGDVSAAAVLARLPDRKEEVETLFSTVEQRRYGFGPDGADRNEMKELLKQLKKILSQCERMKL